LTYQDASKELFTSLSYLVFLLGGEFTITFDPSGISTSRALVANATTVLYGLPS